MSNTLERLFERRATLLKVIHSAEITPSDAKTSTLVHNDKVRRDGSYIRDIGSDSRYIGPGQASAGAPSEMGARHE